MFCFSRSVPHQSNPYISNLQRGLFVRKLRHMLKHTEIILPKVRHLSVMWKLSDLDPNPIFPPVPTSPTACSLDMVSRVYPSRESEMPRALLTGPRRMVKLRQHLLLVGRLRVQGAWVVSVNASSGFVELPHCYTSHFCRPSPNMRVGFSPTKVCNSSPRQGSCPW
jgi:hypothetical protein